MVGFHHARADRSYGCLLVDCHPEALGNVCEATHQAGGMYRRHVVHEAGTHDVGGVSD